MLLAIATSDALLISDSSTLKRSPTLLPAVLSIPNPIASTWAPDNSTLYVIYRRNIQQYDPLGVHLKQIYSVASPDDEITPCVVSKDKGNSLIFAVANKIHVLECESIAGGSKVSKTFENHKVPITSLSLSNDSTLLASTSGAAIHVHNLSLSSHTVLRGLPQLPDRTARTMTCTFSPHLRTRLIISASNTVYVYDITRPSSPLKTIYIGDTTSGDIVAMACSPFSKTLVAAACSGGTVVLLDLDKEKGLLKTIHVNVPLTSLVFSPEGAAIYLGTENGRLLLQDLRSLDKAPKSITVSENGQRVECLSVQRKLKIPSETKSTTTTTSSDASPLTQQDINKKAALVQKASASAAPTKQSSLTASKDTTTSPIRSTPVRKRAISGVLGGYKSPHSRSKVASTTPVGPSLPVKRPSSPILSKVKPAVFSPPRESAQEQTLGDVSVQINTLFVPKRTTAGTNKENRSKTSLKSPLVSPSTTGKSTSSTSQHAMNPTRRAASTSAARITGSMDPKPVRQRTTSTGSSTPPNNLNLRRKAPTTASARSLSDSKRGRSPPSHATSIPSSSTSELKSLTKISMPGAQKRRPSSRSPISTTPDLPYPSAEAVTPFKGKKGPGAVLSLVTPELKKWTELGKGGDDRRQVGFVLKEDEFLDEQEGSRIEVIEEGIEEAEAEREPKVKKQKLITSALPSKHSTSDKRTTWAPIPSPSRGRLSSSPGGPPGLQSSSAGAHSLLHSIMKDVMYDYQEDMRTEIMGLHLDIVRMGRDSKKEMKDVMDVYSKELKELREENRLLREENEKLKRGY